MSCLDDGEHQQTCPLVLPEIFTGEGNFDYWISYFESVAVVNKWNDNDKLLWLRVRLTGKAHVAFDQLAHKMQESYETTKNAMRERFEPKSKRMLYKAEFESWKKKKT